MCVCVCGWVGGWVGVYGRVGVGVGVSVCACKDECVQISQTLKSIQSNNLRFSV